MPSRRREAKRARRREQRRVEYERTAARCDDCGEEFDAAEAYDRLPYGEIATPCPFGCGSMTGTYAYPLPEAA